MADVEPPTQSKAERLAQNSAMLAVGSILCGITAIPAIIQAIRALIRIKKDGASKATRIKAIVSLAFSSCTLAALIFLIVAPFGAAKEMADDIKCVNSLKGLVIGISKYETDHDDIYPAIDQWCDAIRSATTNAMSFHCASAPRRQRCSYAMNSRLKDLKHYRDFPEDTVLLFESNAGWNAAGGPEIAVARHYARVKVAFVDGTITEVKYEDLGKLRWSPFTNSPPESVR